MRASKSNPSAPGAHRLVVLDDDTKVLKTISLMCERMGVQVKCVSSAKDFRLALNEIQPTAMLVDLMMPRVNGIDILERIEAAASDALIFVMTGADERTICASEAILEKSGISVERFLRKPFRLDDLRDIITRHRPTEVMSRQPLTSDYTSPPLSRDAFTSAVNDGQIETVFQPLFDCQSLQIVGFEALARVGGKQSKSFSPDYLNYIIEQPDLSTKISHAVFHQALDFAGSFLESRGLTISVNLFGEEAIDNGFRDFLISECQRFNVSASSVILEISEATAFNFSHDNLRKITELRLLGFRLSLDDFGAGHSSLIRLTELPFSEAKVDKVFGMRLGQGSEPEMVVDACRTLTKKLGMSLVVEGVETAEAIKILRRIGCDILQGRHLGWPVPREEASSMLAVALTEEE